MGFRPKWYTYTNQKKSRMTILVTVQVDFRAKNIIWYKELFPNDKGVNSPKGFKNPKFMHLKTMSKWMKQN